MTDEKYNGWTNYETWNVNFWLTNDSGSVEYYNELAEESYIDAKPDKYFTQEERATLELSDRIKEEIEDMNPLIDGASMFSDLLGASLSTVNWYEVAKYFIEDYKYKKVVN